MKKLIIVIACMLVGCGSPDHEKERQGVCEHIEGYSDSDCNAGDDFSPLTCVTALDKFEGWWRSDAQTAVNNCLMSSACYTKAENIPGPSIQVSLQTCLGSELVSSLQPTDAQTKAVARFCIKAAKCGELGDYTIEGCQEVLLNPYDDGPLFLMMNDQTANSIANCDAVICDSLDQCVMDSLSAVGAFESMNGVSIKMPTLMNH